MAVMTKEDLTRHIMETVVPVLKTDLSKTVAELVAEMVKREMEPLRATQHDWMTRVLGEDGGGRAAPQKRQPGELFGLYCRAIAASSFYVKQGQFVSPQDVAKRWGHADVARLLDEHQAKALAAGDPLAGGFLIPQQFSADVIELLRPASAVRRLGATVIPMPVGSLSIPKITAGATGYYIGENENITKSQLTTGQVKLSFKKLAALTPVSNDLLRYSTPGADAIVRDDIVRALGQAENSNFIRGDGTAGPRGLRYQVAAANRLNATGGTVSLANVTIDLGRLIQALMDNNIPFTRPGWIFAPRTYRYLATVQTTTGAYAFREELIGGKLWGWPYAVNTGVPTNLTDGGGTTETEVYLADFADVLIGESMSMAVDASQEAAYHDGSSVVAAFSQDQTVVRAITEHDLAVRRDVGLAVMNQITWGA